VQLKIIHNELGDGDHISESEEYERKLEKLSIPENEKNKYLRLSEKGIEVFKIHKEQQAYIEESVFSVLNNYSEEELQTVVKLMDDIEKVWGELPW